MTQMTDKQIRSMMISRFYQHWTEWPSDEVNQGWWNLVISCRDLKLWQVGIKPNRRWKVSRVKEYFNIRGNRESLLDQILAIQDFCTALCDPESGEHEQVKAALERIAPTISQEDLL